MATNANTTRGAIVLVHGGFVDGSGWEGVYQNLKKDGYRVSIVQNPTTSLADDVAATKRVIAEQKGPVILVGHSYGGAVITEAAAGNSKVKALVYVAAFAPDAGETLGALGKRFPAAPLGTAVVPDSAGFLYIDRAKVADVFANDLPKEEVALLAATQKPLAAAIFGEPLKAAAWKSIPSWYVVSTQDKAINPDLERFMAKRMNAKTKELKASHVSFISNAPEIAKVIESAAAYSTGTST